ncbi:MAG: hypothetical protein J6W14_01485 [Clostridia bacterium]|nr:hypothetical protein [Clostridia bacterium]
MIAALQMKFAIWGVTVVSVNVSLEQGAKNALMSLKMAGKTRAV